MTTLRILMAIPKYPFPVVGGMERQAYELSKALVARGHAVAVVSTMFEQRQQRDETTEGIRIYRTRWYQKRWIRFMFQPVALTRMLIGLRGQVDVLHVHNLSWFGGFVSLLGRLFGIPVLTKLPNFGQFGIEGLRRGLFGGLRVRLLKLSDAIAAMTDESMVELADIGYPRNRILRIPNGIANIDAPKPRTANGVFTAVYVGRLSPEKGLCELLRAWALVIGSRTRQARLRIIGEGEQLGSLINLASELGVSGAVEFTGFSSDVLTELAKADLFVLPSYAEGNSNSILEAMRAALPVVATRIGGAATQVGECGNPFLVQPGDSAALARSMMMLMENDELRKRVGNAMRRRVEQLFDIARVAAKYEEAYHLLVERRPDLVGGIGYIE